MGCAPFNVNKRVDPELESIRNEFRPLRLVISEIDGTYYIYRVFSKGPKHSIYLGKTISLRSLWERCRAYTVCD